MRGAYPDGQTSKISELVRTKRDGNRLEEEDGGG